TFFEIPMMAATHKGTNSISNTSLRVSSDASLQYWQKRFQEYGVTHGEITERAGHQILAIEDPEEQRLTIVSDGKNQGVKTGIEEQSDMRVFETGEGGNGTEIHLAERSDLPAERPGRGSVHHVALRVDNEEEMHQWIEKVNAEKLPNSGFIDRYYFRSFYFR